MPLWWAAWYCCGPGHAGVSICNVIQHYWTGNNSRFPTPQAREQEHLVLIPLTHTVPEYLHAQGQIPQGRNGVMRLRVSTSLGWWWSWARTGVAGCKPTALRLLCPGWKLGRPTADFLVSCPCLPPIGPPV